MNVERRFEMRGHNKRGVSHMKMWRKLKQQVPQREQRNLNKHMVRRPAGVPRDQWIRVFLDKIGCQPATAEIAAIASTPFRPKAKRLAHVASDDFLLSFEWRQLRMVVLKKRGARCECCGASPADGVTVINVDHIKPRRDFPELALDESNLQILCGVCNHGKGNWDQTDWRSDAPVASDPVIKPRLVRPKKQVIESDLTNEQACTIWEQTQKPA
jgi:5-methylcytosine-specific restriction endonuclease McrA